MTKTVVLGGKRGACLIRSWLCTDDIALLDQHQARFTKHDTMNLEREDGRMGLRLNSEKGKSWLLEEAPIFPPTNIGHQTTEEVKCFTYMGSVVDNNSKVEEDVNSRIGKASSMFQRLCSVCSMSTIKSQDQDPFVQHPHHPDCHLHSEKWKFTSWIVKSSTYFSRPLYVKHCVSDTGIRSKMKKYCEGVSNASLNSQWWSTGCSWQATYNPCQTTASPRWQWAEYHQG